MPKYGKKQKTAGKVKVAKKKKELPKGMKKKKY